MSVVSPPPPIEKFLSSLHIFLPYGIIQGVYIEELIFHVTEKPTSVFGAKLHDQVEDRLNFYETGEAPRKNIDVMKEAIEEFTKEADNDESTEKKKKKLKKAKKKSKTCGDEVEENHVQNGHDESLSLKSSAKKKKKRQSEEAVEDENEKPKKKKKKQETEIADETEVVEKKKKKKKMKTIE